MTEYSVRWEVPGPTAREPWVAHAVAAGDDLPLCGPLDGGYAVPDVPWSNPAGHARSRTCRDAEFALRRKQS